MKRVICLVQRQGSPRRELFLNGAYELGYTDCTPAYNTNPDKSFAPDKDDLLITWNRYGKHQLYKSFEDAGAPVVIVENGYMGKEWLGDTWYAASLYQHNGAGKWNYKHDARWKSFGFKLPPYRHIPNGEIVVLPQRGIGWEGVAMPKDWVEKLQIPVPYRVREHPGEGSCIPLEEDLAHARGVVTWGSGAAIKALAMGIPVVYDMPHWIMGFAATPLAYMGEDSWKNIPTPPRQPAFERLAWAMWRDYEIADGTALKTLLEAHYA